MDTNQKWYKQLWQVVKQSVKDMLHDHAMQWAAVIAYYSLMSVFPLLIVGATVASFFIDPQWAVEQVTGMLGDLLPQGEGQVESVIQEAIDARAGIGLISLALLTWSGTRVFGALTLALNIAYDVDETYPFLKRTAIEFVMMFSLGLLFVLALASRLLIRFLWGQLNLPNNEESVLFWVLQEGLPPLLLFISFLLTYRFVPRQKVRLISALWGAATATLIFMIARPLAVYYFNNFGEYNLIYGSLALVVVLMIWAWIVSLIVLFGGEITSHYQAMVIEKKSPDEVEEGHRQRSPEKKKGDSAWKSVQEKVTDQ